MRYAVAVLPLVCDVSAESSAMKFGDKKQLGFTLLVSVAALYIGTTSFFLHRNFNGNKDANFTEILPHFTVSNNSFGVNIDQNISSFTGSMPHNLEHIEDAEHYGIALMVIACVAIAMSLVFAVCEYQEYETLDKHRPSATVVFSILSLAIIVVSALCNYENSVSRPSLANFRYTKEVTLDPRDFVNLTANTDDLNTLCLDTVKNITREFHDAKHIKNFQVVHIFLLTVFGIVVFLTFVMRPIMMMILKETSTETSSNQSSSFIQWLLVSIGIVTFLMALGTLSFHAGQSLSSDAGFFNPGIDFTDTPLHVANHTQHKVDEMVAFLQKMQN